MEIGVLRRATDAPWRVENALCSLFSYPRVRLLFAMNSIPWDQGWRFYGMPIVQKHRRSRMAFGPHLQLRSTTASNPLGANHPVILATWQEGAVLEVAEHFGMTGGTLCAAEHILIGSFVTIGANSTVIDTDFHPLDPETRLLRPAAARTAPIVIEDHVFVGMNCLVLKGVRIGFGSVIGAGSVVTHNIPPNVIAAGNPARVIATVSDRNTRP